MQGPIGEGRGTERERSQGPKPGVGEGHLQSGRRAEGESGAEVKETGQSQGSRGRQDKQTHGGEQHAPAGGRDSGTLTV